jgi:hypothetical protein
MTYVSVGTGVATGWEGQLARPLSHDSTRGIFNNYTNVNDRQAFILLTVDVSWVGAGGADTIDVLVVDSAGGRYGLLHANELAHDGTMQWRGWVPILYEDQITAFAETGGGLQYSVVGCGVFVPWLLGEA